MKNPTIEQVNFVIKKLKLVREQASRDIAFNMDEARVYDKEDKYKCGTVHCVGGWYAVANSDRQVIKNKFNQGRVGYDDGANLMANDLGFADHYALENWAEYNPRIWGNENGSTMFDSEFSYDDEGFDGVISQWVNVRDNLIKLKKDKTK